MSVCLFLPWQISRSFVASRSSTRLTRALGSAAISAVVMARCFVFERFVRVLMGFWLVVSTPLKNISQWEGLFHILWKIKNVWNHQPVFVFWIFHEIIKPSSRCDTQVGKSKMTNLMVKIPFLWFLKWYFAFFDVTKLGILNNEREIKPRSL